LISPLRAKPPALILREVAPVDPLKAGALARAEESAVRAPFSVQMTRRSMWAALETLGPAASEFENHSQALCLATEDAREQLTARLKRRARAH
jgi:enoyl-CoA hydratase/carnithine racemase